MKYSTYWSILAAPSNSIKSDQVLLFTFIAIVLVWALITNAVTSIIKNTLMNIASGLPEEILNEKFLKQLC